MSSTFAVQPSGFVLSRASRHRYFAHDTAAQTASNQRLGRLPPNGSLVRTVRIRCRPGIAIEHAELVPLRDPEVLIAATERRALAGVWSVRIHRGRLRELGPTHAVEMQK